MARGEPVATVTVQLEISPEALRRLLRHGSLHADELRCLNHHSHVVLRRLLLDNLKVCQQIGSP